MQSAYSAATKVAARNRNGLLSRVSMIVPIRRYRDPI
jgi:hypothetical protein